jgi:hypothetical protein
MFRTNRGDTLMSEDEVDENSQATSAPSRPNNRARSQSVASVVTGPGLGSDVHAAPRRAITSPSSPAPHLVKARYDFEATDTGDLPLRKGQIVEITEEVSEEWARGKSEGESGIFPLEYTEPYTAPAPPAPAPSIRRMLPHPGAPPSVSTDEDTDADDVESTQSDDHDDSVALASAAQPTPTARSRASSVGRKLPPPPPPSRRTPGARPPPPLSRSRSGTVTAVPSASPFAHSDDSPIFAQSLASLQIRNGYDTVDLSDPCDCGCDQFAQNQYKPQGHCARCYHQH